MLPAGGLEAGARRGEGATLGGKRMPTTAEMRAASMTVSDMAAAE